MVQHHGHGDASDEGGFSPLAAPGIRYLVLSFLLSAILALAPSAWAEERQAASVPTTFRILDLQFVARPIAWINEQTILLFIDSGQRSRRKDGSTAILHELIAYNYKSGERRSLGRADSQICYSSDGYVSYFFEDGSTGGLIAAYGPLGKETFKKISPGQVSFDRILGSCRPIERKADRPNAEWQLWPNLGAIACNVPFPSVYTKTVKATLRLKSGGNVALPISCYEMWPGPRYYKFKGAYFALEHDYRSPWPENRERHAFWLFPDGRVETLTFPYSSAIREMMVPTAMGLLAFGRPEKKSDEYWIYVVTPSSAIRVLQGTGPVAVAQDGCKVAILHDADFAARASNKRVSSVASLKVLELCGS
jgi:hypothetical protein